MGKNFFPLLAFWFVAAPIRAWEGHDWNQWREATGVQKPAIQSPQAGQTGLVPLLRSTGPDSPLIDTIHDWEAKRDRILGVLSHFFGEPTDLKPPDPQADTLDEKDCGDYIRRHVRIRSEPDDWIPAYLLLPKPIPTAPRPTMIVLHQTVAQGKDEPCGVNDRAKEYPELALALELVRRGYICLAPDMIGFGERIPPGAQPYQTAREFYRRHPHWSFFGKMVWDVQRIVDWLGTVPQVDERRIGIIGHSHGAYGAIMGAAFEPRISAVVASCGFTTLRADPAPNRWSHLTPLMPRLGFYMDDIKQAPFDWHEIIACLAPRPYFNWARSDDSNFQHIENFGEIFDQLRQVYGLYGSADELEGRITPGPHGFPKEGREAAYAWLDQHLPPRPDPKFKPQTKEEWEKIRPQIKALIARDLGPVDSPILDSLYEILEIHERDGYTEQKIQYLVAEDELVRAYLLLPSVTQYSTTRGESVPHAPGIVLFHQTVPEGKEEPAGHSGRRSMQLGPELVRNGFIVLIPDSICAGERITSSGSFDTRDFYHAHPKLSAMGKMIQDGRRAVTILQMAPISGGKIRYPFIDSERIGVIGHSLGGEEALFVEAFDDRVRAAVSSCGFAPFRCENDPSRWARDHWFSYMPRLRVDFRAGRLPAWDFDDVIRLVAPRSVLLRQTENDEIFPQGKDVEWLLPHCLEVWTIYGFSNAEESQRSFRHPLAWSLEPGPHDLNPTANSFIMRWISLFDHFVGAVRQ